MDGRTRWIAHGAMGLACALAAMLLCSACQQVLPTPQREPTPTVPVRHRDALRLMLTIEDLGNGFEASEAYRLERGKGWTDQVTRLSGYRMVYSSNGPFARVVCQVECYLSDNDARLAYRAYKTKLANALQQDTQYTTVNEREERALGAWGWAYQMRGDSQETLHFIFLRENVLVETAFSGPRTPEFADQAVRHAQIVDQRIAAQ